MSRRTAVFFVFMLTSGSAEAQTPDNVLVVINQPSAASVEIGEYYARARGIAPTHVVRIEAGADETIAYADYVRSVEAPIGAWIAKHGLQDRILYIVLTKGVPIRVRGTGGRQGTVSSVDSELTLLYRKLVGTSTSIVGRQDNPYYLGDRIVADARPFTRFGHDVYLVTRLDGFTVPEVIALIDRAQTPAREGRIVLDQRGHLIDSGGDRWLRQAAERLEAAGGAGRVVLETTQGTAAADGPVLGYYSWGSNDAANRRRKLGLAFAPGALAGMFVSTDGRTFQEPPEDWVPGPSSKPPGMFGGGSQSVVGDLIREGVTGVSAHVEEPYLDGTARPQILFAAYVAGLNLAEAYYLAIPYLSWQNVVIGDPLCAPFRSEVLPIERLDKGMDAETELPALFAERRLAVLTRDGLRADALKMAMRADVLFMRDDKAGWEELLRRAVDLEPRLVPSSLQLATLYEQRGEYDRAMDEYRRALAAAPANVLALNNLAYALAVRKHELDEALVLAKAAYRQSAAAPIADTLGWIHYLRGEYATAKPLFEQATAAAPDSADIQLHAAFVHAAVGDPVKARAALDAALKLDPSLADRDDVKALAEKLRRGDTEP